MRTLLLLALIAYVTVSCSDDEAVLQVQITEFNLYQEASLTTSYPYIVSGQSLVFERFYEKEDEPNIADDEYSDQFFFEVTPENGSFLLEGESLKSINTAFNQFCFCGPTDIFEITDGTISGEEINGVWHVSVDITYSLGIRDPQTGNVTMTQSDYLVFEGEYVSKDLP